jgi:hypothetical protein
MGHLKTQPSHLLSHMSHMYLHVTSLENASKPCVGKSPRMLCAENPRFLQFSCTHDSISKRVKYVLCYYSAATLAQKRGSCFCKPLLIFCKTFANILNVPIVCLLITDSAPSLYQTTLEMYILYLLYIHIRAE